MLYAICTPGTTPYYLTRAGHFPTGAAAYEWSTDPFDANRAIFEDRATANREKRAIEKRGHHPNGVRVYRIN